jgi:hypothetical protein
VGFTNVAWESRETAQLARDLTDGPGPAPVGQAGAAWVRVADELAGIAADYQRVLERLTAAFESQAATRATRKMQEFGAWLQALSLSAAGNGERAEEAAVAHGVAVLAMPNVSEAIALQEERDVMSSLGAYNGAILNGRFAELDEAVAVGHVAAADVMYRYEDSCAGLAQPWDQPLPPDTVNGSALKAEHDARAAGLAHHGNADGTKRLHAVAAPPLPLAPFRAPEVDSSKAGRSLQPTIAAASASSSGGAGGWGGGYGPMAAAARGDDSRQHESSLTAGLLPGVGEPQAGVFDDGAQWVPATHANDAPTWTADVSWSADAPLSDELTTQPAPDAPAGTAGDWWEPT